MSRNSPKSTPYCPLHENLEMSTTVEDDHHVLSMPMQNAENESASYTE